MSFTPFLALSWPLTPRLPHSRSMIILFLVYGLLLDFLELISCVLWDVVAFAWMIAVFCFFQIHVAWDSFQKCWRWRLRLDLTCVVEVFEASLALRVCCFPRYGVGWAQVLAAGTMRCVPIFIPIVLWSRLLVCIHLLLSRREHSSLRLGCVLLLPSTTLSALIEFIRSLWPCWQSIGPWRRRRVKMMCVVIFYCYVVLIVNAIKMRISLGVEFVIKWGAFLASLVRDLRRRVFIVAWFVSPLLFCHWNLSFLALGWISLVLADAASVYHQRVFLVHFPEFDVGLHPGVCQHLIDVVDIRMIIQLLWDRFDLGLLMALCFNHVMQLILQRVQRDLRTCREDLFELEVAFCLYILNMLELIRSMGWFMRSTVRSSSHDCSTIYLAWICSMLLVELFHLLMSSRSCSRSSPCLLSFLTCRVRSFVSLIAREAFFNNGIKIYAQINPLISLNEVVWDSDVHRVLNYVFRSIGEHYAAAGVLLVADLDFQLEGICWCGAQE